MSLIVNSKDADFILRRLRNDMESKKGIYDDVKKKVGFVSEAIKIFPEAVDNEAMKSLEKFRKMYGVYTERYEKDLSEYTRCIEILTAGSESYE